MAYMYRSPSQSSSYSVSAVDGIEIKINENLIPPPAVTRPPDYDTGNPSEILFMEYDFGLEEKVLEWSTSQRNEAKAMEKAKIQQVGEEIAQFAQTSESRQPMTQPPPAGHQAPSSSTNNQPSSTGAWNSQDNSRDQKPNYNPFMNIGSSILTPMPINQGGVGHVRKQSASGKTQTGMIDLKDFENEQDPFENMELRVLNDKEELNKVIFSVQAMPGTSAQVMKNGASIHTTETSPSVVDEAPINLKDIDYPEVESFDSGQFDPSYNTQPTISSVNPFANGEAQQQVQLQPAVTLQTSSNQVFYQPAQPTSTMPFSSQQNPTSNYSYNQGMPLPPIPNAGYYPLTPLFNASKNYLVPNTTVVSSQNNQTFTTSGTVYAPNSQPIPLNSLQGVYNTNPYKDAQNGNVVTNGSVNTQGLAQYGGRYTPPMNPLRSTRSTPDISGSEDRRLPTLMPSSHTPPPINRAVSPSEVALANSPSQIKKETQVTEESTWEHYNVLPASPRSGAMPDNQPAAGSRSRSPLPNPYDSLTPEARRLVENIADMGFPRARVARAVKKQGSDDKKVVDFLCLINRLVEKGNDAQDVEIALCLCDENTEKAEQYLKLVSQFKELGFSEKKIQEALIRTNLDENKTLDVLTAS